jgi:hypothetical protein
LVKIKGGCSSRHGKTALRPFGVSLSRGSGPNNACGDLGQEIITWDFQIFSSASLMSSSSVNTGAPMENSLEKLIGSLRLAAFEEELSAILHD